MRYTCQAILSLLRISESEGHRASVNGARERRMGAEGWRRLCAGHTSDTCRAPRNSSISGWNNMRRPSHLCGGRGRDAEARRQDRAPIIVPTRHGTQAPPHCPGPPFLSRADLQQPGGGALCLAKACGPTPTVTHHAPETEQTLPYHQPVLGARPADHLSPPQDYEACLTKPTPGSRHTQHPGMC